MDYSFTPRLLLKVILKQLFEELKYQKNYLQLERDEVLNTLLIVVNNIKARTAEFICIGDGLVQINDQFYEFEQDNKPDYLGYHLHRDFEEWFESQQQKLSAKDIKRFSLSTDGIFTFSRFDNVSYTETGNIINLLLSDATGGENPNMLNQKMMEIKNNWGLKPTDDLAIIRVEID